MIYFAEPDIKDNEINKNLLEKYNPSLTEN